MDESLQKAIRKLGGQSALASSLVPPLRPQAIQQWRRVPPERVIEVARLTGFEVTPHLLRPDLYPHPEDGLPSELRGGVDAGPIFDRSVDELLGELGALVTDEERQRIAVAIEIGPHALVREIEALEIPTNERAKLLAAAEIAGQREEKARAA